MFEVLLLDEPTSALDPKSSALVSQALEQVLTKWSKGPSRWKKVEQLVAVPLLLVAMPLAARNL